jgi:hypothetical protein
MVGGRRDPRLAVVVISLHSGFVWLRGGRGSGGEGRCLNDLAHCCWCALCCRREALMIFIIMWVGGGAGALIM